MYKVEIQFRSIRNQFHNPTISILHEVVISCRCRVLLINAIGCFYEMRIRPDFTDISPPEKPNGKHMDPMLRLIVVERNDVFRDWEEWGKLSGEKAE